MRNKKGQFVKGEKRGFYVAGMKGKKHSEITKEKMRIKATGKKHNIETIQKLKEKLKGRKVWNKGLKGKQKKKGGYIFSFGEKNPNWKGGISSEREKMRGSIEFRLWRKSVFERDNFTCQKYNIKGGNLCAHHINNFADFPELRFAIDNGITLSEKAHKEFHKKYRKKNNTKEQLLEFLQL